MAVKQQLKKKEKVTKMSKEKLYAVKDDEGLLLLYSEHGAPLWRLWGEMFADKPTAERAAHAENGYVVTLVEEPGIDALTSDDKKDERYRFTEAEIEHYGLQDCEKEEVTNDEQ